jgi:CheY-like chemotaxis protein
MTTILAVEPDPRQASRLSTVLRGRRNTDVVIARSADNAIESIAGRVPDVLLTSQLLSPQDEARLADWLKELGPAASRVQALTIPILAPKVLPEEPQRGLLAGLRRRGGKQAPHGCESKIFAEHVAAYLDRNVVEEAYETVPVPFDTIPVLPLPETIAPAPVMTEPAPEPMIPESTPDTAVTEVRVAEAVPSSALEEDEGLWLLTRSPQVIEFSDEPAAGDHDAPPLELVAPASQVLTLPREVRPVAPFEVVFELPEVITVRDEGCETVARRSAAAITAKPAKPAKPARPAAADDSALNITAQVQDEWGFFDPAKCGFAALLEKLDEISDEDRQSADEVESSVRIVSHY